VDFKLQRLGPVPGQAVRPDADSLVAWR
jgi:hypothetical protein